MNVRELIDSMTPEELALADSWRRRNTFGGEVWRVPTRIEPAGMTLDRAIEIAMACGQS